MSTCEWGYPDVCGRQATWVCYPLKAPMTLYACDQHAPLMVEADRAHRLPSAPPLPLEELRKYVTALAWRAYLETDHLRKENARSAFRLARDEFQKRAEKGRQP